MTGGVASACILHDFVSYQSSRLSFGEHSVTVEATYGELDAAETWS